MNVNIANLQLLFCKPVSYQIPTFQRPYVWTKEQQWQSLWEDVRNTAEDHLERRTIGPSSAPTKNHSHFLGAVVLQQQPHGAPQLETRLVVDGQQRLTTMQLLLDAIQEIFELRGHLDGAERLTQYVQNNRAFYRDATDSAFKVLPTLNDRDAFRHAMDNGLPTDDYEDSLIVQAHEFFKRQIEHWLDELPNDRAIRAAALEHAVTNLLEIVVIDLDINDEPHVIFETLNARGTPLLQSDLVKNMLLYRVAKSCTDSGPQDTQRLWEFTDTWWRTEVGRGRLRSPRIDIFLNYWLTMRTRRDIAPNRVSAEFNRHLDDSGKSAREVAIDIGQLSKVYHALEESRLDHFETFLYRRNVMQTGTLTPVLLWLFSAKIADERRYKATEALESYTVRRMICQMTTKDYNRVFLGLLTELEDAEAEHAPDVVLQYLTGQTAHSRVWPNDEALRNAFLTQPLYWTLTRGRLRLVLEGIEDELRSSNWAESRSAPRDLTIEHIMPQKWRSNWSLPGDIKDVLAAGDRRNRIVQSIGNLTLVTAPLNASMSNGAWPDKRETLRDHTVLFLNKELLQQAPDVWDEAAIEQRAIRLYELAAKAWPSAETMVHQS